MVGENFRTLPVVMYEEVIGLLPFDKGSVIGIMLLVPALIAFIIALVWKGSGIHSFVVTKKIIRPNKWCVDNSFSLDNIIRAFELSAEFFY